MAISELIPILERALQKRTEPLASLTTDDWRHLEEYFGCQFSVDFQEFHEAIRFFWITLEFYDPAAVVRQRGNTPLIAVYEAEIAGDAEWNKELVPFCDLGNGDVYCLRIAPSPADEVFFIDHTTGEPEQVAEHFSEWLDQSLEELL